MIQRLEYTLTRPPCCPTKWDHLSLLRRGSGRPTVPAPADIDYSRTNSDATDLLDVWNDLTPLRPALGLAPVPAADGHV